MDDSRHRRGNRPTDGLPSMLRALPLAHHFSSDKSGRAPGAVYANHGNSERTETRDKYFPYGEKDRATSLNGKEPQVAPEATTASPSSEKAGAIASLLEWSNTQSHILTGAGRLNDLYRAPRFPFTEDELPHHHLVKDTTCTAFVAWRQQGIGSAEVSISGAWRRPIFVGGWTHSRDDGVTTSPSLPPSLWVGETTFNLQTPSIFLDIRVPKAGGALLGHHSGFATMSDLELRLFARRHAFAGYTRVSRLESTSPVDAKASREGNKARSSQGPSGLVATRHHAVDWNYVGKARPRPNKWRVEMGPGGDVWKEWGFAQDEFGQHVYMERWERMSGGEGPFFAFRRRRSTSKSTSRNFRKPDAFLIVCGDHFGLAVDRSPDVVDEDEKNGRGPNGLVDLVDEALARGERRRALCFLSLEASHGRVTEHGGRPFECTITPRSWMVPVGKTSTAGLPPWTVDCSLHPWLQGRRPLLGARLTLSSPSAATSAPRPSHFPRSRVFLHWEEPLQSLDKGTSPHADTATGAVSSSAAENDRSRTWQGAASLEGEWDLVEYTLSPSIEEQIKALEGLFAGSGACVATNSGIAGSPAHDGLRSRL